MPLKSDAQILCMLEASALGNTCEGQIGFRQELHHSVKLVAKDFIVWRSPQNLFEPMLENSSRNL